MADTVDLSINQLPVSSATASTPSYFPGGTITVYGTTATSYYTLYAVWSQTGGGAWIGNGYNFDTATAYIWNDAW